MLDADLAESVRKRSSFKVAASQQVKMLQRCWVFSAVSLVSQKAASSL
ncbi:hypothetical protein VCHC61A1_3780 [Vibrio cholerae HC-61A1]|nr:hypothetical protein VCHC61A1_3780 [Vibrio cholerae HC-61A1]